MYDRRFSNRLMRCAVSNCLLRSLWFLTLISAAVPGSANAQSGDAASTKGETIEEIFVTGSRLPTTGLDTASAVTVMSTEEIQVTGLSSTGELLRELPISGAQSQTETARRGNSGTATAALRGLGSVNTLVLVNGRRLLGSDANGLVDLNSLPFEAIDRVEILHDGASAVYGADAIAGVVNLVMKDSYDGLSLQGYFGISDRSDAELNNYSLTFGRQFDDGGFVFVASYRDQDRYLINARPCCRDVDQRDKGGANLRDPLPVVAAVRGLDPNDPMAELIIRDGVMQATTLADFRPLVAPFFGPPGPNDGFNIFDWETSMSDSTLRNFWFSGYHELGANITGFVEVASNQRKSWSFVGPDGMGEIFGDGIFLHPNNDYNPFGVELSIARTMSEEGMGNGRQSKIDSTTQRTVLGLRGEIGTSRGRDWNWEVSYNTQRLDQFNFRGNATSRSRLQQAAGDSDECRAAALDPVTGNGCVPINLLGAVGTITQEMLDFVKVSTFEDRNASLDSLQFNLAGVAFSLPAGDVQLAIGAEHREEKFDLINDSFRKANDIVFSGGASDAHPPDRQTTEIYVETSLPIFDGVNVDLAVRYSDFNQFGTTTNPKLGLRWRPVEDWLLRASFGTGFRAPTFNEAFGGQSRGFRTVTDPCVGPDFASLPGCNGVQAPGGVGSSIVSGGNPNLEPETADNFTVGVVWTPSAIEGLVVTLDGFRIEKTDVIRSPDINFIVDQNARFGLFPGQVIRNNNNRILDVIALLDNIGDEEVQGFDLAIDYQAPSYSIGTFAVGLDLTYMDKLAFSAGSGLPLTNRVGLYEAGLGTVAEIRANSRVRWNRDKWSVNYSNRFVDGVVNVDGFVIANQKVDSYLQHDVSVSYELNALGEKFDPVIIFGVENILDEDPPFVEGNFNNGFDTGTYNSRGRYYYIKGIFNL